MTRHRWLYGVLAAMVLIVLGIAACGGDDDESEEGSTAGTVDQTEPVRVSVQNYAPFCSRGPDGEPAGVSVALWEDIAEDLGVESEYTFQDYAGALAAIESGRADVIICVSFWEPERAEVGHMTDPFVYMPPIATQPESDELIDSAEEFEGKQIGTVAGYSWIPAFQGLPGTTVRTYPETPTVFEDLAADRLDVAVTDAFVSQELVEQRPEFDFATVPVEPPTPEELEENPDWRTLLPAQGTWFMNQDKEELADAISAALRERLENGEVARLLEEEGYSELEPYLSLPGDFVAEDRRGVDRPADWDPPSWP